MTPEQALAAQPPTLAARAFELPSCARDWLTEGELARYQLPQHLHGAAELDAHDQLAAWDALVGKLIRESLFGDGEPRAARKTAEAVAAEADRLAVALGLQRSL